MLLSVDQMVHAHFCRVVAQFEWNGKFFSPFFTHETAICQIAPQMEEEIENHPFSKRLFPIESFAREIILRISST
jgi:hypothetical protein